MEIGDYVLIKSDVSSDSYSEDYEASKLISTCKDDALLVKDMKETENGVLVEVGYGENGISGWLKEDDLTIIYPTVCSLYHIYFGSGREANLMVIKELDENTFLLIDKKKATITRSNVEIIIVDDNYKVWYSEKNDRWQEVVK